MNCQSFFKKGLCIAALLICGVVATQAEVLYGIRAASSSGTAGANALWIFVSNNPGGAVQVGTFTGVVGGHSMRSIDFRPSNGVLYGISTTNNGNTAQIYTINLTTAALTAVGSPFALGASTTINNNPRVEIEWDPVTDTAKILTGASGLDDAASGQIGRTNNFRFTPGPNTVATNTNMAYADSNVGFPFSSVVASAFSNNTVGAANTTLYVFDWGAFDTFGTLGGVNGTPSPDAGGLFGIFTPAGPFTTGSGIGMDISGPTGICYLVHDFDAGAEMRFSTLNPATGARTDLGAFPFDVFISDISVSPVFTAAGVTLGGRVLTGTNSRGGLKNATVLLTDSNGVTRSTTSLKGGGFVFEDVEPGQTYVLAVKSKLYTFDPVVLTVNDSISDITLRGTPSRRVE